MIGTTPKIIKAALAHLNTTVAFLSRQIGSSSLNLNLLSRAPYNSALDLSFTSEKLRDDVKKFKDKLLKALDERLNKIECYEEKEWGNWIQNIVTLEEGGKWKWRGASARKHSGEKRSVRLEEASSPIIKGCRSFERLRLKSEGGRSRVTLNSKTRGDSRVPTTSKKSKNPIQRQLNFLSPRFIMFGSPELPLMATPTSNLPNYSKLASSPRVAPFSPQKQSLGTHLDLSGSSFGGPFLNHLKFALDTDPMLTSLNLSGCSLTDVSCAKVIEMLHFAPRLESIDLSNNLITETVLLHLTRIKHSRKMNKLRKLVVRNCGVESDNHNTQELLLKLKEVGVKVFI